jgi:copper transport protein
MVRLLAHRSRADPGSVGIGILLALLIVLAHCTDALAHASLIKAEPADGAVLPAPPAALTLTFNEPVSPLVFRLLDPGGNALTLSGVTADSATVTIGPNEPLQRGTHVLSWRVISADGHPVGGALMFSIGAPSGPPAAAANQPSDQSVRAALWVAKVILYLGLFVGAGGAFFRAWLADLETQTARSAIAAALAAGLVAAATSIGLQGLDALDLRLPALAQRLVWETGISTAYGSTAVTAAVAIVLGLSASAARSQRIARGFALLGLVLVGTALSLSGHASTAAPALISRPAVFLHGVCVAFWIGALLPLLASLRAAGGGRELERFSRAIPLPLLVLAASGLWLAFVQLGRVDALWTTSYGQVLACKLGAVCILLGLAAGNRYWLVPRFQGKGAASARLLAMSIAAELLVAVVILGLVALWRFTPPPRALALAAPISIHLHGEKAMAQIEIERADGRAGHASIMVLDGAFQPFAVKEVTLVLASPAAGIERIRRAAAHTQENIWSIDDLRIPLAGRWNVSVEILVNDFEKVTVEDAVALPRVP